jgi:hypothetical protein
MKIIKTIQKINPTAQVSVSGDDINTIQFGKTAHHQFLRNRY